MTDHEVVPAKIGLGASRVTREQQAVAELGITRFSRGVPDAMIIVFLLTIVAVPVFENISDVRANLATRRQMLDQGVAAAKLPGRRPRSLDVLDTLPSWSAITSARGLREWVDLLPKPIGLRRYEDTLVLKSAAGGLIRPWVQWILTGWLGTGSEKVLVGRDGLLFYSDGVQYVTGPGFLNPEQLVRRSSDGLTQADPRQAIVQFHAALRELGVSLVILPIPDKAMIRPGSFSPFVPSASLAPQNPSWEAFCADLQQRGIPLLDLTTLMNEQERDGGALFLRTDSHWSPRGADLAARALADFLTRRVEMSPAPLVQYSRRQINFLGGGDLVVLLDLPLSRALTWLPKERLTAGQVVAPSGARWEPDPASEVLVIGDSFSESYMDERAGLAEQLSYYLQRPVDRIASHLWGKYGAREALGETLAGVRERARGRKVVIWEFAMRNLAVSNWPLMN